jgi:hypothetical protein
MLKRIKEAGMGFKMTITEALMIPKGMNYEEYGKLLDEQKKLHTKIRNLSNKIQDEADSLEILDSEHGSERYNKHLQAKQDAEAKREKAQVKLQGIEAKLGIR